MSELEVPTTAFRPRHSVPNDGLVGKRYRATLLGSAMLGDPECGASMDAEPPPDSTLGLTVWIASASASRALEIAERLRDLHVDVRIWRGLPETTTPSIAARLSGVVSERSDLPSATVLQCPRLAAEAALYRGGLAPGALRRVRAHIESALAERIDVNTLARMTGLSDCHFARAFRQSVGVPPHRYIMGRRVAAAAGLLENTDCSLTDIALTVGFADQSHFTHAFARFGGETPGVYRRRHR